MSAAGSGPAHPSADLLGTPAAYFRGGTSKALLIRRDALPFPPGPELDRWVLATYGSPDPRQVDGIGGGEMLTSKLAVLAPVAGGEVDVEYSFFQVGVDEPLVARDASCGNIASAVALFAVEEGWVEAREPTTKVRITDTNLGFSIVAELRVDGSGPRIAGESRVDGVPGSGSPISLDFSAAAGTATGSLLPLGSARFVLEVDGVGALDCSVVDMAALVAFVPASQVGLVGDEDAQAIEADAELMARLERVRGTAAVSLGLASSPEAAAVEAPGLPFLSLVSSPSSSSTSRPTLRARGIAMRRAHRAYWVTGAICTAVAARLPGTVTAEASTADAGPVSIGHPSGSTEIEVEIDPEGSVERAVLTRTARRIMDGTVYAPRARL